MESDQRQVFIKVDQSNPQIDQLADEWLMKNDPDWHAQEAIRQKETEKLFFTGPKQKQGSDPDDDDGSSNQTTH
jgi:hypothetical protein